MSEQAGGQAAMPVSFQLATLNEHQLSITSLAGFAEADLEALG